MIDILSGALTGDLLMLTQYRWLFQLLQAVAQQDLRGVVRHRRNDGTLLVRAM